MDKLKVYKLGYRVAIKSSVLRGVFDLTSDEAKLKQVVSELISTKKSSKVYENEVIDRLCKKYMNGSVSLKAIYGWFFLT